MEGVPNQTQMFWFAYVERVSVSSMRQTDKSKKNFLLSILTESQTLPSWPGQSQSRNVHIYKFIYSFIVSQCNLFYGPSLVLRSHDQFQVSHRSIGLAGSFIQQLMSRINQLAAIWQDPPGSSQLAGSTRRQMIGRINQIAA